jgi:hypothetical protein
MNSAPSELIQSSLNNKKIEFERKREEKVEGILLRSKANFPFVINFSDWAHSLNVILPSHKYFCSSVSLIL